MKKILLLLISLTVIACENSSNHNDTQTFTVDKGPVQNKIQFAGRVRSENSVLIRAPFDSNLVKLNVSLGQKIEAGQGIVVISKPEDNSRISQLIKKRGFLDQLKYRKDKMKLKIINNNRELKRLSRLLASGSIAANERERIKMNNDLERKEYKIVQSQIVTVKDEIKYLKRKERDSSKTVKSPISGTVTELWTEESNITPGMNVNKDTTIAVVEKFGRYILKGTVSEPDYINMEIGQKVKVKLAYVREMEWTGTVKSLSPTFEGHSLGIGRFTVNVVFDADKNDLRTGLEGIGIISLEKKENVVRVPRSALSQVGSEFYVSYPTDKGNENRIVKVGLIGDSFAEVKSGLAKGDSIYKHFVSVN